MKKICIFGTGSFAKLLNWYIENDTDKDIDFFCVEDDFYKEEEFCGKKVKKYSEVLMMENHKEIEILLGIGYRNMNNTRKRIFEMCKKDGFCIGTYIHSSCIINTTDLGEGNIILENSLIEPFSQIGDGNLIWYNVTIAHDNCIGDYNTLAGCSSLCGNVNIGNNCFVGNSATIKDGVTVADYTLIGAASFLNKNTDKYNVVSSKAADVFKEKKSVEYI